MADMSQNPDGSVRDAWTVTRSFEIYVDFLAKQADFDFLKSLGFNQLISNNDPTAIAAAANGFSIVLSNWWNTNTTWVDVEKALRFAGKFNDLISINMMDEPTMYGLSLHPPDLYLELRRKIRDSDNDQPLSLTMYGPQPEWPACWGRIFLDYLEAVDILRIATYPVVGGRPLRVVADWINLARSMMMNVFGREIPLTVVLQAWDLTDGGLPTMEELRVMAYMALFSGADVLSFFDYNPEAWSKTPGFTAGFTRLMAELVDLSREFAGAAVHPIIGGDDLFQVEIDQDGDYTCMSVNTLYRENGFLAPLQIVRERGRCARPSMKVDANESLRLPIRKPDVLMIN